MLLLYAPKGRDLRFDLFQWAPTLGGECYETRTRMPISAGVTPFQWAPTLGGECYYRTGDVVYDLNYLFQRAPTLGGECYSYP